MAWHLASCWPPKRERRPGKWSEMPGEEKPMMDELEKIAKLALN
jgi:hypothetical protein